MRHNVKVLEKIIIDLLQKKIKTITLNDLECKIMYQCGINKKEKISWYIEICVKFGWIKQMKKEKNKDFEFEITYKFEKGELF